MSQYPYSCIISVTLESFLGQNKALAAITNKEISQGMRALIRAIPPFKNPETEVVCIPVLSFGNKDQLNAARAGAMNVPEWRLWNAACDFVRGDVSAISMVQSVLMNQPGALPAIFAYEGGIPMNMPTRLAEALGTEHQLKLQRRKFSVETGSNKARLIELLQTGFDRPLAEAAQKKTHPHTIVAQP